MKNNSIFSLLALLVAFTATVEAQSLRRNVEYETMTVDTLDDDEALNFTFSKYILDHYDVSWQVGATSISGTAAATVTLEASNCESCGDWEDIQTWTLSASELDTIFVQQYFPGIRARVRVSGSGTQATQIRNHVRWIRRKQ